MNEQWWNEMRCRTCRVANKIAHVEEQEQGGSTESNVVKDGPLELAIGGRRDGKREMVVPRSS